MSEAAAQLVDRQQALAERIRLLVEDRGRCDTLLARLWIYPPGIRVIYSQQEGMPKTTHTTGPVQVVDGVAVIPLDGEDHLCPLVRCEPLSTYPFAALQRAHVIGAGMLALSAERTAVAQYIREVADSAPSGSVAHDTDTAVQLALRELAQAIERGEYERPLQGGGGR